MCVILVLYCLQQIRQNVRETEQVQREMLMIYQRMHHPDGLKNCKCIQMLAALQISKCNQGNTFLSFFYNFCIDDSRDLFSVTMLGNIKDNDLRVLVLFL